MRWWALRGCWRRRGEISVMGDEGEISDFGKKLNERLFGWGFKNCEEKILNFVILLGCLAYTEVNVFR
jgi:hypothetical protein